MTDTNDAPWLGTTPAGCYYAVQSSDQTPERSLLQGLMQHAQSPSLAMLCAGKPELQGQIQQMEESGLLASMSEPDQVPESRLSDLLPTLLPHLSHSGRVVLTESRQGLFIDYVGVSQGEAEELAALAARLRTIADKSAALLSKRLAVHSRAFGIVDPAGNSEIGFWPMYIGDNVFTLTLLGIPRFNIDAFRRLVWALILRYDSTPSTI